MVTFGSMRQWLPIFTGSPAPSPITEPGPMVVSSPILTCSPRTARGPMATFLPILAEGGTMAAGWATRLRAGAQSNFAARAQVGRGWGVIRIGLEALLAPAQEPAVKAGAGVRGAGGRQ